MGERVSLYDNQWNAMLQEFEFLNCKKTFLSIKSNGGGVYNKSLRYHVVSMRCSRSYCSISSPEFQCISRGQQWESRIYKCTERLRLCVHGFDFWWDELLFMISSHADNRVPWQIFCRLFLSLSSKDTTLSGPILGICPSRYQVCPCIKSPLENIAYEFVFKVPSICCLSYLDGLCDRKLVAKQLFHKMLLPEFVKKKKTAYSILV